MDRILAVTEIGSVAVVAKDAGSGLMAPASEGDKGVGVGCSEAPLLMEPAFELAALGAALDCPIALS